MFSAAQEAGYKQVEILIDSLPNDVRESYSQEALEQFADLFSEIDVDDSQSISVKELKDCFRSLEITITSDDLRALFQNLGTTLATDIEIEFPAFCNILKELYKDKNSRQRFRDNIREILTNTKESKCDKVRKAIWKVTDEPSSSKLATALAYLVSFLIILSTLAIALEADPVVYSMLHGCLKDGGSLWDVQHDDEGCAVYFAFVAVEGVCVVVFTIEYAVRLATAPNYRKFFFSFSDTIDLLSILPFYLELVLSYFKMNVSVTEALRVFRLVRTIRILRISRHSVWSQVFMTSVAKSRVALATIGAMMLLCMVIFSALMYNFERFNARWDEDLSLYVDLGTGKPSMFQDIPRTFWWCIITMCLVGFGDEYPLTFPGQAVAIMTTISGMVLLAIPVSVISANFKIQFDRVQRAYMRKLDQKVLRDQIKQRVFHADRDQQVKSMRDLRERFYDTLENMCELNKTRLAYQFRRAQRAYRGELVKSVTAMPRSRTLFTHGPVNAPNAFSTIPLRHLDAEPSH